MEFPLTEEMTCTLSFLSSLNSSGIYLISPLLVFTFVNSAVQNINLFTYLIGHLEKLLEAGR